MLSEADLEIIVSCIETEASFLSVAQQHGIDTRPQRAALFSVQARVLAQLADARRPAPKEIQAERRD